MDDDEIVQKKRGGPKDKRNAFKRMSGRLLRSFGNFNEDRDDVGGIRTSSSTNNLVSASEPDVSKSLSSSTPSASAVSFPPPSQEIEAAKPTAEKSTSAKKRSKSDPKKLREQMRKRSVSMSGNTLQPMLRARTPLNCTVPMARVKPQFGLPPSELLEKFPDEPVPAILVKCIGLLQDSLREQGIFRIPGKMTDILEMKISFEQGNQTLLEEETNVHNIAGLVSQFFRELPEPLLTFGLYKPFVNAAGNSAEKKRLPRIKKLLKKLPQANFYILEFFIRFLVDLSKHSGANRMTPQNLALVFGASLLNPQELELSDLGKIKLQCTVVELLITQYAFFFEGAAASDSPAKQVKAGPGSQRKLATIPAGRPTIPAGSMNSPRSAPTSPVAVPAKTHDAPSSPLARSPLSRSPNLGRAAPLARPVAAPPTRKRASSRLSSRPKKTELPEPSSDDSSPAAETQSAKQQSIIRKNLMSAHSHSLSSEAVRSSLRDEIAQPTPPTPPQRNKATLAAAATAAEY